jgi:quercetin dioxygenase-like cupin family protein
VQWSKRGEQAVELHPGDVIYAPDGEEHRHGATPHDFMTHLSITEGPGQLGEHVTDDEFADACTLAGR